eukprot:7003803-Prymnesium_polylepis.1
MPSSSASCAANVGGGAGAGGTGGGALGVAIIGGPGDGGGAGDGGGGDGDASHWKSLAWNVLSWPPIGRLAPTLAASNILSARCAKLLAAVGSLLAAA